MPKKRGYELQRKYMKEKTKSYPLLFYPSHKDLWEHIHNQSKSVNSYLVQLVRDDMNKNNTV